ncbi:hypothetical protein F4803DRAFT_547495 [Xylaria telfairii]|nr:hypothetical protein F4803DRAFT_547495 [Xylaria telfairii]
MTVEMQRQDVLPKGRQPAASKRKRADTSSSAEAVTTSNKRQCLTKSLCLSGEDDTRILNTVDARYEVQLQSVISSSKIQQRVTAMLRYLTPPTQPPSTESVPNTTASKTRVSILRAKATEAGKLISIAEIAKREIEKELSAGDDGAGKAGQEEKGGQWFQYIALGEELIRKPRDEGNTIIEETVLGGLGDNKRDHDEDDEFEVMKTPFERAIAGQPLVRGVPIMSLFLSRSPVEELKKRYGEQTNVPHP